MKNNKFTTGRKLAKRSTVLAAAMAAALATTPQLASAATRTWNGGSVSGYWSSSTVTGFITYTNWGIGLSSRPVDGDSLIFAGANKLSNINDYLSSIVDLSFAANAGAFALSGNGLTITGALSNLSNNLQTIDLPLTVGATGNIWDGGSQGIALNGAFTLGDNSLTLNNNIALNNATGDLIIGDTGTAALTLASGSTASSVNGFLGNQGGGNGSVTVTGAGSAWTNSGVLTIGNTGTGTLNILNGGTVSNTDAYVGRSFVMSPAVAVGSGTVTVDGVGSTWNNRNLSLGDAVGLGATDALNIQNGGTVNSVVGRIRGPAAVTVDGNGSTWNIGDALNVERYGTLNIQNGGSVITSIATLGGTTTVTGTDSILTSSSVFVAGGTLNIQNGGKVSTADGFIRPLAGASGIVTVDGIGSTWTNSGTLAVGDQNASVVGGGLIGGVLNILHGGTVSSANGNIGVGTSSSSYVGNGTVTVDGIGSTWTNSGDLNLGSIASGSSGTLNIQNGGKVSNTNGTIGAAPGYNSAVTVDGMGSTWTNSGTLTVVVTGILNIQNGGAVSASSISLNNSSTFNLSGGQVNASTIALANGSTLNYTGNNSIQANFTNNGAVSGSGGALTFLGDVNGAGSFAGDVLFQAAYNPGNSQASVSFGGGNATFDPTAVLTMELWGATPGTEYDQLTGINMLTFNGTLNLVFGNGYTPGAGTVFDLLLFQSFSGVLNAGNIQVVGFDASKLDFSQLAVNGTLSVAAVPLPNSFVMLLSGFGLMGFVVRRRIETV